MQLNVIFDTNAYRSLVHGLQPKGAESTISMLRQHEEDSGIRAFASPYVMLEMLAHLADTSDPAYPVCLSAVCALQKHCEVAAANGQIALVADVESQLARGLYEATLEDHQEATQILAWTCLSVQQDPSESHLNSIRSTLIRIRDWSKKAKDDFVDDMRSFVVKGFNPAATDWAPLQQDQGLRLQALNYLESDEALRELARSFAFKANVQAHKGFQADPDFESRADFVLQKFSAPLLLYREIARRIVMTGCDLTKKNRANWLWDIHIVFAAGQAMSGQQTQLVTDDNDVVAAAEEADLGSGIISLSTHLARVQKTEAPNPGAQTDS